MDSIVNRLSLLGKEFLTVITTPAVSQGSQIVCLHLHSSPNGPVFKTPTTLWVLSLRNPIFSILLHFQVYFSILHGVASLSVSTFPYRHQIIFKVKIEGAGRKSRKSPSNLFGSPCLWALLPQLSPPSSSQASLSAAL